MALKKSLYAGQSEIDVVHFNGYLRSHHTALRSRKVGKMFRPDISIDIRSQVRFALESPITECLSLTNSLSPAVTLSRARAISLATAQGQGTQ